MPKASKMHASMLPYLSTNQLGLEGFVSPFSMHLNRNNRWFQWAQKIPWDTTVCVYDEQMRNRQTGASHMNRCSWRLEKDWQ